MKLFYHIAAELSHDTASTLSRRAICRGQLEPRTKLRPPEPHKRLRLRHAAILPQYIGEFCLKLPQLQLVTKLVDYLRTNLVRGSHHQPQLVSNLLNNWSRTV